MNLNRIVARHIRSSQNMFEELKQYQKEYGRKLHKQLDDAELKQLADMIENANGHEQVDAALDAFDKAFEGFGIEAVQPEGAHVDNYYYSTVALYSNMGDTYVATLVYDTDTDEFMITSWGDFYEEWEREQAEENEEDEENEEMEEEESDSE